MLFKTAYSTAYTLLILCRVGFIAPIQSKDYFATILALTYTEINYFQVRKVGKILLTHQHQAVLYRRTMRNSSHAFEKRDSILTGVS